MPGRTIRLTLIGAVTALAVPSIAAGPVTAAPLAPPVAQRVLPGCDNNNPPAQPITTMPWAQQRYAPERLAPLATGAGVTVAVIDSGVDKTHPQMKGRVLPGRDYLDPGLDGTRDCVRHGTGAASIIAATPREGVPFRGLAPQAKILPVRVSEKKVIEGKESGESVTVEKFAESIRWAVDNGASVINLSIVYYQDNPVLKRAVEYALEKDVVLVAAAGNLYTDKNPRPYPTSYDGVIGVGSVGEDGVVSPFSQRGDYVDLVAPGGNVVIAAPERGHLLDNGTSFATPFVTATVALIRQYWPELNARQVTQRLLAATDPVPGSDRDAYGAGLLNPYRAVTDTAAPARRQEAGGLPPHRIDPVEVARAERRSQSQERALWVAGLAGTVALVALLLAVVLPRGARRRWRPAAASSQQPSRPAP
ncbi:type VII secretion-associated serine protease mycosin [Plantactinospora sp. BB1]|uniref:type VII secretion-associated serine protease mycosin n=1 Tax=Plantactinospora sp. BB1 TaxID=2071627 RepID=UPI000D15130A|nr:type VII secretion-associated serine protease mycosin [Plantactinospora sp. BB1]AVT39778.1 type VII secretion-associated serine protease mycosin [Plantactinospora sp. BB1]